MIAYSSPQDQSARKFSSCSNLHRFLAVFLVETLSAYWLNRSWHVKIIGKLRSRASLAPRSIAGMSYITGITQSPFREFLQCKSSHEGEEKQQQQPAEEEEDATRHPSEICTICMLCLAWPCPCLLTVILRYTIPMRFESAMRRKFATLHYICHLGEYVRTYVRP